MTCVVASDLLENAYCSAGSVWCQLVMVDFARALESASLHLGARYSRGY
jgi:hypothetical protein